MQLVREKKESSIGIPEGGSVFLVSKTLIVFNEISFSSLCN